MSTETGEINNPNDDCPCGSYCDLVATCHVDCLPEDPPPGYGCLSIGEILNIIIDSKFNTLQQHAWAVSSHVIICRLLISTRVAMILEKERIYDWKKYTDEEDCYPGYVRDVDNDKCVHVPE